MNDTFFEKVRQMRIKQREYFKNRKQSTLIEARVLERDVDKMIAETMK